MDLNVGRPRRFDIEDKIHLRPRVGQTARVHALAEGNELPPAEVWRRAIEIGLRKLEAEAKKSRG